MSRLLKDFANLPPLLALLRRQPLFWVGLAVRLLLIVLVVPFMHDQLFAPFLEAAHNSGALSAYTFDAQPQAPSLVDKEAFPYPLVMFAIAYLPYLALKLVGLGGITGASIALGLAVLAADFVILAVLVRWVEGRSPTKVLAVYWLSPALLYINYLHGQLDAIPVALLFLSLHFLFKGEGWRTGLALGAALAAKTTAILAIPFYAVHLLKSPLRARLLRKVTESAVLLTAVTLAIGLCCFPNFRQHVLNNGTQTEVFALAVPYGRGLELYVMPTAYAMALVLGIRAVKISRTLFLMLLGFGFSLATLFIAPQPGWFVWPLPLMCFFISGAGRTRWMLFVGLQLGLVSYFVLGPDAWFWTQAFSATYQPTAIATNLAFTFGQAMMFEHCFWMYRRGLSGQQYLTGSLHRPIFLGIAGDSGSGKTTLSRAIGKLLGSDIATVLCGDGMHKWERGDENWSRYTHLNPSANELHEDCENMRRLRAGETIYRREYDHSSGKFTDPKPVSPRPWMVFEGLHAFYLKPARNLMDLCVFMSPNETLRTDWKIARDSVKRGHSPEHIKDQLAARAPDKQRYIEVQAEHADLIFGLGPDEQRSERAEDSLSDSFPEALEVMASNRFYLETLLDFLANELNLSIQHSYESGDRQRIYLQGSPRLSKVSPDKIDRLVPGLRELIYPKKPHWQDGWAGVMTLIVLNVALTRNLEGIAYDRPR